MDQAISISTEKTCFACGVSNEQRAIYCDHCGTPFGFMPPVVSPYPARRNTITLQVALELRLWQAALFITALLAFGFTLAQGTLWLLGL